MQTFETANVNNQRRNHSSGFLILSEHIGKSKIVIEPNINNAHFFRTFDVKTPKIHHLPYQQ